VIKVTLEFNSWAEAVAYMGSGEKAVAAGKAAGTPGIGPKATTVADVVAERAASGSTLAAAKDNAIKKNAAAAPSAPAAPAAAPASSSVDYATLAKAVFELATKNRDTARALVDSFGVKTFKELDPSLWGQALEQVNTKLAELQTGAVA
jgi:hypothetical protein